MKRVLTFVLVLFGSSGLAQVVVPTRTIQADAVIAEHDITLQEGANAQGFDQIGDVIGQEARNVLYAGRPILLNQIGPPAIIKRNQIVGLFIDSGTVRIATEARSLQCGAVGDIVRVMNLASRTTLYGQVKPDGTIEVSH